MEQKQNIRKIFAERLDYLIKDKGLNVAQFATDIKIPRSTINDWLLLKTTPKIDCLPTIARYFGISIDFLLGLIDFE